MTAWARAGRTAANPSIGIGGHLAVPPLPHHRAYGSVPRRFGGLSARQRIHGEQPKTFEASVGESAMQRARRAQMGHKIADSSIPKLLGLLKYRWQVNRKTLEGSHNPDRN